MGYDWTSAQNNFTATVEANFGVYFSSYGLNWTVQDLDKGFQIGFFIELIALNFVF